MEIILQKATEFWEKNVKGDTPPEQSLPSLNILKRVRRQPKKRAPVAVGLIEAYQAAQEVEKTAKDAAETAKAEMLAALGDAEASEVVQIGDAAKELVYLEQSKDGLDAKKLQAELPDVFKKYMKTSTFRVARIRKFKES
jgi:predicted phage-related endonuclease